MASIGGGRAGGGVPAAGREPRAGPTRHHAEQPAPPPGPGFLLDRGRYLRFDVPDATSGQQGAGRPMAGATP